MSSENVKIKLERYLMLLERQLRHLPPSERSSIVHEVKKDLETRLAEQGPTRTDAVFQQLGPAEQIAAQELKKRGLPPPPRRANWPKRLLLSVVISSVVFTLLALFAVWKFSPIVDFDRQTGQISFFGGALNLDELDHSTFQFQSTELDENGLSATVSGFSGDRDLTGVSLEKIVLTGINQKLEITTAADQNLSWRCQGKDIQTPPSMLREGGRFVFDFNGVFAIRCRLEVPQGIPLDIQADHLNLEAHQLLNPLKVAAKSGRVFFLPAEDGNYRYQLAVENGKVDDFVSSPAADAYLIDVSLAQGSISRQSPPPDEQ